MLVGYPGSLRPCQGAVDDQAGRESELPSVHPRRISVFNPKLFYVLVEVLTHEKSLCHCAGLWLPALWLPILALAIATAIASQNDHIGPLALFVARLAFGLKVSLKEVQCCCLLRGVK